MSSSTVRLLLAALFLCMAVPAQADDTACIAQDMTPFQATGSVQGRLSGGGCYAVLGRDDTHTRLWVTGQSGFQGEVSVLSNRLAYILVDDVDLRLSEGDEPYGQILSGALVALESTPAGGLWVARSLEGRVHARFLVSADDIYPAAGWVIPDPEDAADGGWPEATLPLPPESTILTAAPDVLDVRAAIDAPLFHVEDLLNDPAFGQVRLSLEEVRDYDARVRLVGPTLWVEGWVTDIDWRSEPPEEGWDPDAGRPTTVMRPPLPREVGTKGADLFSSVKGDKVGKLQPGARLRVLANEGRWLEIESRWEGGEIRAWLETKRLVKEGKESTASHDFRRMASVSLGKMGLKWDEAEGHEEEPELELIAAQHAVRAWIDRLRWIYAGLLREKPMLSGNLTVRLLVDPSGKILEASVPLDKLGSMNLSAAVLVGLEGLEFPKRKVPRRRRGQPEVDWNVEVWLQYRFASLSE